MTQNQNLPVPRINLQHSVIILWLFQCAVMIFIMAIIGAITRLTESGLSMVEWRPILGWIPPTTNAEWNRVFDLYTQSPEFSQKHSWMELADFKRIYFWEWLHRLWGRLTGLVYIVPLVIFWVKGIIPAGYKGRFILLLLLGAVQGGIGWWMVKSGLIDRPDVSHFRLAVHLAMAILLLAGVCWTLFDLYYTDRPNKRDLPRVRPVFAVICFTCLCITILWGAFVAGLDAGRIYNTFPMMDGSFTPSGDITIHAILNDHGWVQFAHRWLAISTGALILLLAWHLRAIWIAGTTLLQIMLGITALLTQLWIPAAAMHQAGALILFIMVLKALHASFYGAVPTGDADDASADEASV